MKPNATNSFRGFQRYVAPTLLYVIFIFWIGSIRMSIEIPEDVLARDKLNHFAAFGLLTLLCMRSLRYEFSKLPDKWQVVLSIATSSVLGAMLEVWQLLFPYRSSEFLDWVADTLGSLAAGLAGYLWLCWRARRVATSDPVQ